MFLSNDTLSLYNLVEWFPIATHERPTLSPLKKRSCLNVLCITKD